MHLAYMTNEFSKPYLEMIRKIAARPGMDVSVMCAPQCPDIDTLKSDGIRVVVHNCRRKIDPSAIIRIRSWLKEEPFDIVHALQNRCLSNALLAAADLQSPRIVGYLGTMDVPKKCDPATWITVRNPPIDGITCVSHATRDALKASGCRARLAVVHTAQEPDWIEQGSRCARVEFNIAATAPLISCIANARPVKGLDVLLDTAKRVRSRVEPHFMIIGETSRIRAAKELIPDNVKHRVHFTGYRSDAGALLAGSDIYVQPSRKEGLPKSVLEAMSLGICPVVTRVGGMPEIVRHQVDGIVVSPNDSEELGAAIEMLLTDSSLRRTLGMAAAERIESHFRLESMVNTTCAFYESILGSKSQPEKLVA